MIFNVFFHYFDQYFCFFMIFWLSSFCGKSTNKNLYSEKTFFSYLMNWDLGYLQSSVDENKIAIRKSSIRSIRKLSYFDQQTIVGGPHFNLTNGEISFILHYFFVKFIFQIISSFCFNFDWSSNYFNIVNATPLNACVKADKIGIEVLVFGGKLRINLCKPKWLFPTYIGDRNGI